MGYSVVDPDEIEPIADRAGDPRPLAEAAGLETVALNRFRAAPGEQIPLVYHYHEVQEEAFVVLSGTLRVETPEGEFEVPAGSIFAAQPESPHRAYNPSSADETVEVVAIGAPAVEDDAVAYERGE